MPPFAREIGADGVHLTAEQLRSASARPDFPLCGASCHSIEELRRAEALGVDFVVLDRCARHRRIRTQSRSVGNDSGKLLRAPPCRSTRSAGSFLPISNKA